MSEDRRRESENQSVSTYPQATGESSGELVIPKDKAVLGVGAAYGVLIAVRAKRRFGPLMRDLRLKRRREFAEVVQPSERNNEPTRVIGRDTQKISNSPSCERSRFEQRFGHCRHIE